MVSINVKTTKYGKNGLIVNSKDSEALLKEFEQSSKKRPKYYGDGKVLRVGKSTFPLKILKERKRKPDGSYKLRQRVVIPTSVVRKNGLRKGTNRIYLARPKKNSEFTYRNKYAFVPSRAKVMSKYYNILVSEIRDYVYNDIVSYVTRSQAKNSGRYESWYFRMVFFVFRQNGESFEYVKTFQTGDTERKDGQAKLNRDIDVFVTTTLFDASTIMEMDTYKEVWLTKVEITFFNLLSGGVRL